jgi:hypothetical protein
MQEIKSPIKPDAQSETENLQLWIDLAERRLTELRAWNACEYPADEVLQDIRAVLA